MESAPHWTVLGLVLAIAFLLGVIMSKTNFCTMGAVSDWWVMGDTGRLRSWLFAMALAIFGVGLLESQGVRIGTDTFPPYRTSGFAWARYVAGGLMFGIGMTLASGCGNKTLVRIGGGNLKSLVALACACFAAYLMLWTSFYSTVFDSWLSPLVIDLRTSGIATQAIPDILKALQLSPGFWGITAGAILCVVVAYPRSFRANRDLIVGGGAVGLAVVAGWLITAGSLGEAWKEYAAMAATPPARVASQSFTFISPMGDLVRYLAAPARVENINFGIVALLGVIAGSSAWSLLHRSFRLEWFADYKDAARHIVGGALMGVGGVLAMGCTIGQGVTGVSTLAAGSFVVVVSIVAGCVATIEALIRWSE